jgi:hypothetical protein
LRADDATHAERTIARVVLAIAVSAGTAMRLWLAFRDHGIFWPDEIYQSLEPAHHATYGYGRLAWEFVEGARNWTYPGLIAAVLELCAWFDLGPAAYLGVLRTLCCLGAAGTGVGIYVLARRLDASALSASIGSALFLLAEPVVYFGHRAMSETACALPLVWGMSALLPATRDRQRQALGAALLAFAVLLRLQTALFCLVVLGIYAVRRDRRGWLQLLAILAGGALLYGFIDRLTWGGWFHSALLYFRFNVIEGKAARWGVSPFYFYGQVLISAMLGLTWLVSALSLPGAFRAPGLAAAAALFFAVHSAIGHKEIRFIFPAIPLFCALAALGLDELSSSRPRRRALLAVSLLLAAASALRFPSLRMAQLDPDARPHEAAYDRLGPVNRLLLAAHGQPDLCGLSVPGVPWWELGGHSYLHRKVPLYAKGEARPGAYNYLLHRRDRGRGERIASDGEYGLYRVAEGCGSGRKP